MKFYKKITFWLIAGVIAAWLLLISLEAKAEVIVELAPAVFVSGDDHVKNAVAIAATQRFMGKYDIGIVLLIDAKDRSGSNRAFQVARTARYKRFEVGVGYTWWGHASQAWNTDSTFALHLGWWFGDRLAFRQRHWSTGGTSGLNDGLDIPTLGMSFGD